MPAELVPLGVLGRPYGLKGELRVNLFDSSSEVLLGLREVYLAAPAVEDELASPPHLEVVRCRRQGNDTVLRLEHIADRTAAETYRGSTVLVPRSALPEPDEGEYYDFSLIGLEVRAPDGHPLGQVVAVEHPPANDVLVVRLSPDGQFTDVPMVKEFLLEVDLTHRFVTVDLPPGLPTRKRR
jgi:16S rRNA processing protein RimM